MFVDASEPVLVGVSPVEVDGARVQRVPEPPRYTERGRQVEVPDPDQVDAVDLGDRVDLVDAARRLDLGDQQLVAVGLLDQRFLCHFLSSP